MLPHPQKDFFKPEEVDEQIDAYQQPSAQTTPDKQLIDTLHTLYTTQSQRDTVDDTASLAKVKQRLYFQGTQKQDSSAFDAPVQQTLYSRPQTIKTSLRPSFITHKKSFQIAFAAAVITCLLVGSFLTFVLNATHQQGASSVTGANIPTQTAVYVQTLGQSSLKKLNAQDGSQVWQQTLPTASNKYTSSDNIIQQNGVVYVIRQTDVSALRASNGQVIWHHAFAGGYSINQSLVNNGRVYLYLTQAQNGGINGTYAALAISNGMQLWQNTQFGDTENTPILQVVNNTLYTIYSKSGTPQTLYAVNGATGAIKWHEVIGGNYQVAPVASTNGVVYTAMQNKLYAFDEQTGQVRWQQQMVGKNKSWQIMNVYPEQGMLITYALQANGNTGNNIFPSIYVFHIQDGTLAWSSETGRLMEGLDPAQPLPVFNGNIFSVTDSNENCQSTSNLDPGDAKNLCQHTTQLQAHNINDGHIVWQAKIPCPENVQECYVTNTTLANGKIVLQIKSAANNQKTASTSSKPQFIHIYTQSEQQQTILVAIDAEKGNTELSHILPIASKLAATDGHYAYIAADASVRQPALIVIRLTDNSLAWQTTGSAFSITTESATNG